MWWVSLPLYFNLKPVTVEDVPVVVRECIQNGSERRVYVWVDTRARIWRREGGLDGVRDAGIEKVARLVEKLYSGQSEDWLLHMTTYKMS